MGEATYTIKATFGSEKDLNKVFPQICDFIEQGQEAEDFWQSNRHTEQKQFWGLFKKKFPEVYEYLGEKVEGDNNNELAGQLDFGMNKNQPEKEGKVLTFSDMVWHFASWDGFADYLKTKFGAKRVSWKSDEY